MCIYTCISQNVSMASSTLPARSNAEMSVLYVRVLHSTPAAAMARMVVCAHVHTSSGRRKEPTHGGVSFF